MACPPAPAVPAPSPTPASSRSGRCSGSCRPAGAAGPGSAIAAAPAACGLRRGTPGSPTPSTVRPSARPDASSKPPSAFCSAPQVGEPALDRPAGDARSAQRLDRGRGVVRVRRAGPRPAPAARRPLGGAEGRTSAGGAGRPACRSARIVQIVALTSGPMRPSAASRVERGGAAARPAQTAAERVEREVGLRRQPRLGRGEVATRSLEHRRRAAGGAQPERRPGGQGRSCGAAGLGEAAARRLPALEVGGATARAASSDASRRRGREQPHAHTTSVRSRRS